MRILSVIDSISEWSGRIFSFLIVAITFVMIYDVILRYAFNAPVKWPSDVTLILFAIYVVMGGAYALLLRAHVSMDLLHQRFSPRRKAIVDLATSVLFFLYVVVLVWKGWQFGLHSLQIREEAATIFRAPIYPAKMSLCVAAALLLLQGMAKWCRDLITAITGREAA